jgi:thiol-disulfide isomerase/thioredoxin
MASRRPSLLALAVVTAFVVSACGAGDASPVGDEDVGQGSGTAQIAPIFSVETTDGEFSLSEHLADDGRPVFLNLWASWCFPCREEMPAIDASSKAHPEVRFVGVSVQDSRSDAASFAEEIGVSYTLGFDDDGLVDDAYRPLGLPASYLISPEGIIVERIFGKVTEETLDEKIAEHFG